METTGVMCQSLVDCPLRSRQRRPVIEAEPLHVRSDLDGTNNSSVGNLPPNLCSHRGSARAKRYAHCEE